MSGRGMFLGVLFFFCLLLCELGITSLTPILVGLGFIFYTILYSGPDFCRMWMFVIVFSMNRESVLLCK
jgi:hypothetical protein